MAGRSSAGAWSAARGTPGDEWGSTSRSATPPQIGSCIAKHHALPDTRRSRSDPVARARRLCVGRAAEQRIAERAPAASAPAAPSTEVSPMSAMPSSSSPAASPSVGGRSPLPPHLQRVRAGDAIPREFTCDGANVSPPLAWADVPAGTAALVLLVDDPDARDFVHWIVLDLPGADGDLRRASRQRPHRRSRVGTTSASRMGRSVPAVGHPPLPLHAHGAQRQAGLGGRPDGGAVRDALAGAKAKRSRDGDADGDVPPRLSPASRRWTCAAAYLSSDPSRRAWRTARRGFGPWSSSLSRSPDRWQRSCKVRSRIRAYGRRVQRPPLGAA